MDGSIAQQPDGSLKVLIRNSGEKAVAAGTDVSIAAKTRSANASPDLLLGLGHLPGQLAPGASAFVSVRVGSLPDASIYQVVATCTAPDGVQITFATLESPPGPKAAEPVAASLLVANITPIPDGYVGNIVATVDGKYVFQCNLVNTYLPGTLIEIYDPVTGQSVTKTLSHAPDSQIPVLGHKVFFAGEVTADNVTGLSNVDIYDDETGQWSTATLSAPRRGLNISVSDNKVIFALGYASYDPVKGPTDYSNVVDIYDGTLGTWSSISIDSTGFDNAYTDHQFVVAGSKILYFADFSTDYSLYNLDTGQTTAEPFPSNISGLDVARVFISQTLGNKILFPGSDQTWIYDTAADQWSIVQNAHRYINQSEAVDGNKIAIFYQVYTQGVAGQLPEFVDIYDLSNNVWTSITPPHAGSTGGYGPLTFYNGNVYLFRGPPFLYPLPSNLPPNESFLDIYNTSTGQWSSVSYVSKLDTPISATETGDQVLLQFQRHDAGQYFTVYQLLTPAPAGVLPPSTPSVATDTILDGSPTTLSWTSTLGTTSYDVYLDGELAAHVADAQWAPTTPILPGSHEWQVVANVNGAVIRSGIWRFDIAARF